MPAPTGRTGQRSAFQAVPALFRARHYAFSPACAPSDLISRTHSRPPSAGCADQEVGVPYTFHSARGAISNCFAAVANPGLCASARVLPYAKKQMAANSCWRALKKSQFWAAKMSHSALEERAARRLCKGAPWTDRRAGSKARRCSPERGEEMHEVSKRVLFRALLKGGMSKAAISRELANQRISRRTPAAQTPSDGDALVGG